MTRVAVPLLATLALLSSAPFAACQEPRWDASLELARTQLSAVDETATSAGLRLSYRVADWLAADVGVQLAPGDLGKPAFSGGQTELLAGLRVGPRLRALGAFASLRGGFVRYAEAPQPLACILIFPPPLVCELAAGHSAPSVQLGAGAERTLGPRGLLRLEVGDRLVRLPGPSFDANQAVHDRDFWSHELRIALSVGLRF